MLWAVLGCGARRAPAQPRYQLSESLLAELATLPSLEALPHPPAAQSGAWGTWAGPGPGADVSAACFGHVGKTIPIDPHSPYLPGSFPRPGGQPAAPAATSAPLPCFARSLTWHARCSPASVSPLSWGASRPDTAACSFSPRCTGVTRRIWAPSPRMRRPGCGCRRGTLPGPAAPRSCWSTPRAAVPRVGVRLPGIRAQSGHGCPPRPGAAGRVSPAVTGHRRRGQWHLPAGQRGHNGPK